jgi:uncharacterized protein (DUF885 family)
MQRPFRQAGSANHHHGSLSVASLLGLGLSILAAVWAPSLRAGDDSVGIGNAELARVVAGYTAERASGDVFSRLQQGLLVERIPVGSLEEARDEAATARRYLDELAKLDQVRLDAQDQLSLKILRWSLEHRTRAERNWWYEFPVTTYTTFDLTQAFGAAAANPLATPADRQAYLSLLASIADRLDTSRDRLARQAERGIRLPAPAAGPAAEFFRSLQPRFAAFATGIEQRIAPLDATARAAFSAEVQQRIDGPLETARTALVAALDEAARTGPAAVGLSQYPGGREVYRDLARFHTSLDVHPDDLRDYGEARIRRINGEIEALAQQLRITGGRAGIRAWLQSEKRFIARGPEDVATRYRRAMARITPLLPAYFNRQPRAPWGVRRLDSAAEASMTFGYYAPPSASQPVGEYHFNGSRLDDRPLIFTDPIIYHELLPGHHFQIALQLENGALPPFRRRSGEFGFNAYTEGWAEYAAELADEMGLYDDPYDRLGRLMLDAFLSARLVVDTGLNYHGWSLEEARRYMRENTYQSETEIQTETLRYSTAIPGQALGYKVGHRVLDELRTELRKKQGERFDIKAFHDAVLDGGAMPLGILQSHVRSTLGATTP